MYVELGQCNRMGEISLYADKIHYYAAKKGGGNVEQNLYSCR